MCVRLSECEFYFTLHLLKKTPCLTLVSSHHMTVLLLGWEGKEKERGDQVTEKGQETQHRHHSLCPEQKHTNPEAGRNACDDKFRTLTMGAQQKSIISQEWSLDPIPSNKSATSADKKKEMEGEKKRLKSKQRCQLITIYEHYLEPELLRTVNNFQNKLEKKLNIWMLTRCDDIKEYFIVLVRLL